MEIQSIRVKAFFNEAQVDEVYTQIEYDWTSQKTLWYGLRFSVHSQIALLYPFLFLARRLLFAALLVYGTEFALWQIYLIMYTGFGMMWLLLSYS